MRIAVTLIAAQFANFFGFWIVSYYLMKIGSAPRIAVFLPNEFTATSLIERMVVLCVCATIAFGVAIRQANSVSDRSFVKNIHWNTKRGVFELLTALLLLISAINLLSTDFNFNIAGRGLNQKYVTTSTVFTRLFILVVPIYLFYLHFFISRRSAKIVSAIFLLTVILDTVITSDRRNLFYYILPTILFLIGQGSFGSFFTDRVKKILISVIFITVFIFAYLARTSGLAVDPVFVVLQSTIGALGIGEILPKVQEIAAHSGYYYGTSFLYAFLGLFFPQFLRIQFGLDEMWKMPSIMFDRIVNQNPNMGFDFMMLADFYWNFSYLGYALYVLIFYIIARFAIKSLYGSQLYRINGLLITTFYVAGQRSDFNLFLKSSVYCVVLTICLFAIFCNRRVSV